MSLLFAGVVGLLFAVAIYLLLRGSLVDHVFGLIVLSHAANLFVFGAGRLRQGAAPILGEDPGQPIADPLPQALVLTAIVIGFGVVAFATLLVARLHATFGTDDVRVLEEVERA
jgi:multicomponent Na+:H+ antiporter subunit C